ncbi:MAG TPA: hypothetical protein VFE78_16305 [Gemmataceae bacterium]|nr:hypothetical protein [Gemmataceae bacterium]
MIGLQEGPPPLTLDLVLAWADHHHQRTGNWPRTNSGPVPGQPGEDWEHLDRALRQGKRGLPGGTSLARLLTERRGVRNRGYLPHLTEEQVVSWARAHRARTGRWPAHRREEIEEAPGELWCNIDGALRRGGRGLPGGSSLHDLLCRRVGLRRRRDAPRLTVEQVLAWADAHRARTGRWPHAMSGPVADAPGESWRAVNLALWQGHRGLPGGVSLSRLLDEYRRGREPRGLRGPAWLRTDQRSPVPPERG